ncbi:type I restriction enzyme HsdR N-terminal domain-containing protein [Nitratireductor kimnyeongensis]|uniref:Type I restriction enzyme HsdR N-terminal domain-containing protein n=1 Tax=Nitratireductor kimnyeongensis TaxID=430679 RepID=A0ABW0T4J2_9HYPH|nr:type I restriction enzyme HsdR N-terminal domain-containing protein [Nitratireductor kimnyeongensis]QZZ34953.1 type I restriction enzyme HsdR N-terminal domain-containing protein [Nitratireductor kimnyeongensis]
MKVSAQGSIFAEHDIDAMNEDDVAGELVRPLCRALGYRQGGEFANLRSQIPLQYDRAFLGHKDAKKDPPLRGRPDFVCEVVSYARWVVEAKRPSVELSLEDSQQAHTYATHPEIAAEYYMLTNGREFRVYRVGRPDSPVFQWMKDETNELLPALRNLLGPDAMKKKAEVKIDLGKPLAPGFGSAVAIVGGEVVYEKNVASIPLNVDMDGLRNSVVGWKVFRREDGLISAEVEVKSAFTAMDELHKAMGFSPLLFNSADEFISLDKTQPTLLQNVLNLSFKAGTPFPKTLLSPAGVIPFDVTTTCYTEALGFIEGNQFRGTFVVDYDYLLPAGLPGIPSQFEMRSEGTFEIAFA